MPSESQKIWFITGASTGFGKELAKVVVDRGDIAIATFRKEEQVDTFNSNGPEKQLGVMLDVTKPDQIHAGVQIALDTYNRIDVLVNNAGYGSMGSLEEIPEKEIRYQFEVNVFGAINMTKAVLPHMRAQRSGHIINITSIAGLVGFPGVSIYNSSKFALEGIGEALAAEVAHLGIKVTNIEPGPFRTDWAGRSASYVEPKIEDYAASAGERMKRIQSFSGNQVGDPARAANAMYELTKLENPPVHLPLGEQAYRGAKQKLVTMKKEIEDFESLGLPTDYPEEA